MYYVLVDETLEDGVVQAMQYMARAQREFLKEGHCPVARAEMEAAFECFKIAEKRLLEAMQAFKQGAPC